MQHTIQDVPGAYSSPLAPSVSYRSERLFRRVARASLGRALVQTRGRERGSIFRGISNNRRTNGPVDPEPWTEYPKARADAPPARLPYVSLARVLFQPGDRHRPGLLRCFHVRAVVARLRAEEAMGGPVEDVRLVCLAERFHLRFRWRDGVADARVLRKAAVEPDDRRCDVGHAVGHFVRTGRCTACDRRRIRRRLTVIHDRGVEAGLGDGERETLRAAKAVAHAPALAVTARILQPEFTRGFQLRDAFRWGNTRHGCHDLLLRRERRRIAAVFAMPDDDVRRDGNEAFGCELVGDAADPVAQPEDLHDHDDDWRFAVASRVNDPRAHRLAVDHDIDVLALARRRR